MGELKANFDVSLFDCSATSAVIIKDHYGQVKGPWINSLFSNNSFCVEMKVAIQAFLVAKELKLHRVCFEGDALQVIITLQGLEQFSDWRASFNIKKSRMFLLKHTF